MRNKAKQQAMLDIQADLESQGKCFLAFVKKFNPVMGTLVRNHIADQQKKSNSKKAKSHV